MLVNQYFLFSTIFSTLSKIKFIHLAIFVICKLFTTQSQLLSTLRKKAFENIVGKGEKCWLPAFSPFPTMFSTLLKTNFNFLITFILLSASSFNLDSSKVLLFGKELRVIPHFTKIKLVCYKRPELALCNCLLYEIKHLFSGIDPSIIWPSEEELEELVDIEKNWTESFQDMMERVEKRKARHKAFLEERYMYC